MTVADLQRALIRHGFDPGGVDGHMTARTVDALKAFQAARGLAQTGMANARTVAALSPPPPPVAAPAAAEAPPIIAPPSQAGRGARSGRRAKRPSL